MNKPPGRSADTGPELPVTRSRTGKNTIEFLVRENATLRARVDELEDDLHLRASGRESDHDKPETILGLNVMILYVSPNGQVGYLNSPMATLLGKERDELLGLSLLELDQFHWGPGLLSMLRHRAQKENQPQDVETRYFERTSGEMRYVIIRATPSDGGTQYVIEDRTNYKHLQSIFSRYVSPRVIEQMLATGKDYLEAKQVELTLLFSDLRDFTPASESLPPKAIKQLMDSHLAAVIDVLSQEDGTVDKILGDGIMAFFGAPVPIPDHPVRALNAAIKMQRVHDEVMKRWVEEGLPALPMGIGINTGTVVVGNIGCEQRMEYTALGHDVNVAARLCKAARGGEIILSDSTFSTIRSLLVSGRARLDYPVKFRNGFKVQAKGLQPIPTVVAFQLP